MGQWDIFHPPPKATLKQRSRRCTTARGADCRKKAVGGQDALPPEALLVIERAHVTGCLVYPSKKLFACTSTVEHTVDQACKEAAFGDLFRKVLADLINNGTMLWAAQHCNEFTAQIIHFYLVTRMHFFARSAKTMTMQ